MARLPFLPMRQCGGDAVEHTFDVDVDHSIPFVDLETFQGGKRHQAGIVQYDIDVTELPNRCVD